MSHKSNDENMENAWEQRLEQGIAYLKLCGYEYLGICQDDEHLGAEHFCKEGIDYFLEFMEVIKLHEEKTLPEMEEEIGSRKTWAELKRDYLKLMDDDNKIAQDWKLRRIDWWKCKDRIAENAKKRSVIIDQMDKLNKEK